jgi:16S rRNA (adenine1518-N6/adenine1519-N6)-dimethyltransferase
MENISFARSAVKKFLSELEMCPSKNMGQNFLLDANFHQKLITAADVQKTDVVLEVGGGLGHLTQFLLERAATVWCVELDRRLAGFLCRQFSHHLAFRLFSMDVLASKHRLQPQLLESLSALPPQQSFKLVANLPYSVATPVIMNFLALTPPPVIIAVTIQKEVAERLTARPGSEHYGYLSVYAQFYANIQLVCSLPPLAFYPPPQVASAIITLTPYPPRQDLLDKAMFYEVVQKTFQARRKTIINGLRRVSALPTGRLQQILQTCAIAPDSRGEDLSLEEFIRLSNELCAAREDD